MIMIELLIATTLVLVLLIVFTVVRKMRDRKSASQIIHKIKEDEARRTAETKKVMLHKFGFEDAEAEKIAVQIDREERSFYQNVINMYLRRDASALESLDITFEGSVEPYRTLEPPGGGGASDKPVNESEELQRLKEENKRLSEEIGVTMQTMGRMLSEYSTMFAEKAKEQESSLQEEEETQEQIGAESEANVNQVEDAEEVAATEAEEENKEAKEDPAKDVDNLGSAMIEEMDDLSDLDSQEEKDLKEIEAPENPDELLG